MRLWFNRRMKTYSVYVDGKEQNERIPADNQNQAMMIAKAKYPKAKLISVFWLVDDFTY